MTTIKVTPELLISVSKQFELAQQTAIQMNGQLLRQISFMERFWDGITKEQFYYSFHISQKNMDDFVTLTDSIAKELRHHADKFSLADAEQGNMIGVTGSFPALAASMGMMNTKGVEQRKPAYDYDEYDKKFVGNMWILSKNGVTDQEAAKATLAYNEALKKGDIKLDNESEDVDINLVQIEAFKQGYNPWTGEKLSEWHAKSLIVSSVFSSFMGIRNLSGGRVKINKGFKIKSGSNRISKADFKNGSTSYVKNITIIDDAMKEKILFGQRKFSNKNDIIGGHSPKINNGNPNYAVEEMVVNTDGTRRVKYTTQFPDGNLSKIKTSTLFPNTWSDDAIINAIKKVADSPSIGTRDGITLHRSTINGIEIEVMKNGNKVISGFSTGGVHTPGFN
ncbi:MULTISPECIES: EndoU domain-containing protein [unclassified Paenibacillus]|uniref:EndoU domain-containing protein n=1 Tax=unclassified Paenibacillus TaxID=185978 RepID=UPI0038332E22